MKLFKNGIKQAALWGLLITFVFSCASAPDQAQSQSSTPPDWVMTPPESNKSTTYFVASGSDASGNLSDAEKVAAESMIAEITRYMGVKITTETNSEAKATMDEFSATMTQTVKAEGSARVAGFKIEEKWIQEKNGSTTVYLLGSYNTADLEREKARIAAVFREQQEAVSGPEREANSLMGQGRFYEAALKFVEAAVAASTSTIENSDIKVERNINSAREALSRINMIKLNDNLVSNAAEPFEESFLLKVASGASADSAGLADVPVRISYKEKRSNGRMSIQTARISTDSQGNLEFTHPVPTFVGDSEVTMTLDIQGAMESLYDMPSKFRNLVTALEDAAVRAKVSFEYTVVSRAKEIPTGILVLETDRTSSPLSSRDSAAGLLQQLTKANFNVKILSLSPEFLLNASDSEILDRVKVASGNDIERLIYGVAQLSESSESGSAVMVKVDATIKVAELSSGRIIYSNNRFKRARGSSSQSAVAAAFRQLGESFGEEMAAELP